jgi:hypothetical protein
MEQNNLNVGYRIVSSVGEFDENGTYVLKEILIRYEYEDLVD